MKRETEELLDLMIAEALHGLGDEERDLLDQYLLHADPDEVEKLEQELEAALAIAGNTSALEQAARNPGASGEAPPRGALVAALEADADRFFGIAGAGIDEGAEDAPSSKRKASNVAQLGAGRSRDRGPARADRRASPGVFGWTGWAVAALLLVTVWVGRPGTAPEAVSSPDAAEARTALLGLDGTEQTSWGDSAWAEFSDVQGDVVWNDDRQEGYLRLVNMPSNDPSEAQYQLWIVDPTRDEEPVDGGVFDVPPGAREVVVPIRAKLAVRSPAAFAITREQPGGVVVSEGPLLVVASRG